MAEDNQEINADENHQTVIIDSSDNDKTVVCADGTNLYLCWKCRKAFTELPDFIIHKETQCEGDGGDIDENGEEMAVELVDSQNFIALNVEGGESGQQFIINEQNYEAEAVNEAEQQYVENAIVDATEQQTQEILHIYTTDGEELNIVNIQNADGEGHQSIEIPPGYTIVEDSSSVEPSTESSEAKVEIISTSGREVLSSKTILGTVDEVTNAILTTSDELATVNSKEDAQNLEPAKDEQTVQKAEVLPENIQEVPLASGMCQGTATRTHKHVFSCIFSKNRFWNPDYSLRREYAGKYLFMDDKTNLHYMCSVCGARYLDEDSCRAHMEDHYEENAEEGSFIPKSEKTIRLNKQQRKFKRNVGKGIGSLLKKLTAEKSNVKCDECGKVYISETRLKQHQKIHSNLKPYECNVCLHKFRTISYLKNHMNTHLTEKTQKCPHCDKTYKTFNDLRYHKRVKHGYMKAQKCPICANKFVIEAVFIKHLKNHLSEITYECKICQKIFSSNYYLSIHKKAHSGDKIMADLGGSPCHIHTHGCTVCYKRFTCEENLKVHMIMHNEEKPYKCSCGRLFKEGHKYRSHAVSSCHIDVSSLQPKFHCSVCPKSFYSAYHQSKHEETHLKKRELYIVCPVCEQFTPQTYVCTHCQQEFDSKDYFSIHLLLHKFGVGSPMDPTVETFDKKVNAHSGKEVFQCQICKEEFEVLEHAMLHEKSHNTNLTCKFCSITYATKKNLMKHLRTVHGLTEDKENEGVLVRSESASIKPDDNTPDSSPSKVRNNSAKTDTDNLEKDASFSKLSGSVFTESGKPAKSTPVSEEKLGNVTPIPLSTKIKRTAICEICKVRFASKLTLLNHIREEHFAHPVAKELLVNGIECNICHKTYPTRYDLVKHKNKKHKWDDKLASSEDFFCVVCRKVYMTEHSLSVHIFRKHEGGEFTQNRPHACTLCDKAFVTKSGWRKHLRFTHDVGFGEPCPGMERENSEGVKIKVCPVCNKVYNNMPDLKQHILKRHPDDHSVLLLLQENANFECSSCSVAFTKRSDFIEHVKEEHPDLKLTSLIKNELVHCDECDKVFYDQKHYERHAKSHQSEIVMCNICYSTHKRPATLKLHMKKYHPDICGTDITEKKGEENGTVHLDGSIQVKEEFIPENHFVCEVCGLFFTSKIVLKRHLSQKHVKDCKHICSYCARGFATREACNKHEKRHKALENSSSVEDVKPPLSKEQREAIRNKPIECSICWKSFVGKKRFRMHLQKQHPISDMVKCDVCYSLVDDLENHTCVSKSDECSNDSFDDHFIVDEATIESLSSGEEEDIRSALNSGPGVANEVLCEKCEGIFPSEKEYLIHLKEDCIKSHKTDTVDSNSEAKNFDIKFEIKLEDNMTLDSDDDDIVSETCEKSPKSHTACTSKPEEDSLKDLEPNSHKPTAEKTLAKDLKFTGTCKNGVEQPSHSKHDSPAHKENKEGALLQTSSSPSTPKSGSDNEVLDRKSRHSRAKKDFSLYHTPTKQTPRFLKVASDNKDTSIGKKNIKKTKNTSTQIKQDGTQLNEPEPDPIKKSKLQDEDEKKKHAEQTCSESHASDDNSITDMPKGPKLADVKIKTSAKVSKIISSALELTPSGDCSSTTMKRFPVVLLDRIKIPMQQLKIISNSSAADSDKNNISERKKGNSTNSKNESLTAENDEATTQPLSKPNNKKPVGSRRGSVADSETKNIDTKTKQRKTKSEDGSDSECSSADKRNKNVSKSSSSETPKAKSLSDEVSKIRKRNASKAEIGDSAPSESKRSKKADTSLKTSDTETDLHCKICNKGFLSNRLYVRHMTIHDDKKNNSKKVSEYQKVYITP